jgi:hypothetical protein
MSDFESALAAKLARNAELEQQRRDAEVEMDLAAERAEKAERERLAAEQTARDDRHAELADALQRVAQQLKQASPETFIVRMGWTETREEFITKISTRTLSPARSLFIELDHDDDEVLVRWNSDAGNAIELWRLLEFTPEMLNELVLQIADQDYWRNAKRPPAFPGASG